MLRVTGIAVLLVSLGILSEAQGGAAQSGTGDDAAPPVSIDTARQLAGKGRLEQAMAQLDQLAAQKPEPAGVERMRGIIFYQLENFPAAIEAFTKAAVEDPKDSESVEMHGVTLFRQGNVREAIPFLEKARAAVVSANVDPDYVLALCYADVERYDDSRHAFARQFGFAPDSAEAYLLAGRMFLRREARDQARVQVKKALELNPKLPLAHELLGEIALAQGDTATAVQELEEERKIDPMNPDVYDREGDAYVRSGQYAKAQEMLNRAVLLEPQATGPYILLGETFLKLSQPIQALHYLDHAVRMDPRNYITHNLLGQAYRATGQVEAANREFQMVVDLQHQNDAKPMGK